MEKVEAKLLGSSSSRVVLIVLWIPSADRDGKPLPNQDEWKEKALNLFGTLYSGATAMPKADGIWRDDERGGNLVRDTPILLHCYVTEEEAHDQTLLPKVGAFCRKMGRETHQGAVILLIDGEMHTFKNFS